MTEPDPRLTLDLQLFAVGCKLKLYTYGSDWYASAEMQNTRYFGQGSGPSSAVYACFMNARHNLEGKPIETL